MANLAAIKNEILAINFNRDFLAAPNFMATRKATLSAALISIQAALDAAENAACSQDDRSIDDAAMAYLNYKIRCYENSKRIITVDPTAGTGDITGDI